VKHTADRSLVSEQVHALIPTEQDKAYPDQLAPISPAAELSRHAIAPDQSPAALAARSESPPPPTQPSQPEIGPTPGDRLKVKSGNEYPKWSVGFSASHWYGLRGC